MAEASPEIPVVVNVSPKSIPWYRSRGFVWGLVGVALALLDGVHAWLTSEALNWRTGVILIGGALAAYFRKNITGIIVAVTTGEAPGEPKP